MPQSDRDGAWSDDPLAWFLDARERARGSESFEVTRAALATASRDALPSVRFVLVKVVDTRGFTFFTNHESDKAQDLADNPHAALAFHWHTIGLQVRVRGAVERISDAEADQYFETRPQASQRGAWASDQSRPIEDRKALDARLAAVEARFAGAGRIARPANWGGYRLVPVTLEFWGDREGRLHDRWLFTRDGETWSRTRLQP